MPLLEDLASSIAIWTDPQVRKYLSGTVSKEQLEKGFREDMTRQSPYGFLSVLAKDSGLHIGDCGLLQKEIESQPEAELVYFFSSLYWGKGYASEAAALLRDYARESLKLPRLVSLIHPDNVASRRVAEKVGMTYERQVVRNGGTLREVFSMAL
jgi:ribosomal-protein-alanine N-acetyltransferase